MMNKLKEKIIDLLFVGEDEEEEEIEVSPQVVKRRVIISFSIMLNLILNVLYVSLVCYSGETKNINLIFFIISFIWTVVSLVSSYRLYGKYTKLLLYLNLFIIMFISKLWFVYL